MRHLAAVVLVCVAAVACGNASPDGGEHSASTAEDLINPNPGSGTCYSGYTYQCHSLSGHEICGCEALSCNWVTPPPPPGLTASWVASWTVGSNDGSCLDIPAPTGRWKNLSTASLCSTHGAFDGIPCQWSNYPESPAGCNPSNFGTPSCCTYVWWPAKFVEDTSCADYSNTCPTADSSWDQFPQVLCAHAGMKLVANEVGNCTGTNCGGGGNCRTCNQP